MGWVNINDINHGNSIEKVYKNEDLKFNKIYPYYFIAINNGTSFTWRLNGTNSNTNPQTVSTVANEPIKVSIKVPLTSCYYMFYNCQNLTLLDLNNFNTSNVTNMSHMFHFCSKLTSLDLSNFDTSEVTNMQSMFANCTSLTSLDLSNFDTSKVTSMGYMFNDCNKLTSLNLSSNFNIGGSISRDCSSLTTITGAISKIVVSLYLHYSPLTVDSAMLIINSLAKDNVTGRILTLKASTYDQLSTAQIAIATAKNWSVTRYEQ